MPRKTTDDHEERQRLRVERDELRQRVEHLEGMVGEASAQGAAAAWADAETLLAELVMEHADETVLETSLDPLATTDAAQERPVPELSTAGEGSRRKLLAIRDAVRERDRRLGDLRRQKDELLSIVAHDLRTPLVAIQGFIQLLRLSGESSALTERQREYVNRIAQAARTMNALVEDLLTARKLEQGRLPLRPRPVEVEPFLQELLSIHAEGARQKEVSISLRCDVDLPRVVFDPDRIGQALGNLVQNGVRFTPAGKSVRVAAHVLPDTLSLEVLDQGPGVPEPLLQALFDRNRPPGNSDATGRGSGLGLSICRDIVLLHGGTVGAENLEEGGCRFWVRLPAPGLLEPEAPP